VELVWKKYLEDKRRDRTMATIKIKQIKSKIGYPVDQKRTLEALGLHKISQVVEKEDSPVIRGMIRKVHHLVEVID
jgi:large subunit ribosomal protein L30